MCSCKDTCYITAHPNRLRRDEDEQLPSPTLQFLQYRFDHSLNRNWIHAPNGNLTCPVTSTQSASPHH